MSDNLEQDNITKIAFRQDSLVNARGTEDGLVIRIDGRAEWPEIETELDEFLGGRKKFFAGGQVSIEWLERLPTKEQSKELEDLLVNKYGLTIAKKRKKSFSRISGGKEQQTAIDKTTVDITTVDITTVDIATVDIATVDINCSAINEQEIEKLEDDFGKELLDKVDSLSQGFNFDDIPSNFADSIENYQINPENGPIKSRALNEELRKRYINRMSEVVEEELIYDGEANAKIVVGTLRSGQKIETPFSLVVLGDVNPGADLTAGGDIIVLGNLRGTAHAGAYDDNCYDKVIVAQQMQPVQLRIGSIISRGNNDKVNTPEIARIDNRRIVVESYNPRNLPFRKKAF